MAKLYKLIYNENLKLYRNSNSLIIIAGLSISSILSSILTRVYDLIPKNVWSGVQDQLWLVLLIDLFVIIVAGSIVANEFNWGTIKLLLIRPVSRSKILFAKFIAVTLFSLLLISILFGLSLGLSALFYDFVLPAGGGNPSYSANFAFVLETYLLKLAEVLTYGALAMMLSVFTKSSVFAIGFSIILMFIGPQLVSLLGSFSKFYLFAVMDFTTYGRVWSMQVLFCYILLFLLISWLAFRKKDITD